MTRAKESRGTRLRESICVARCGHRARASGASRRRQRTRRDCCIEVTAGKPQFHLIAAAERPRKPDLPGSKSILERVRPSKRGFLEEPQAPWHVPRRSQSDPESTVERDLSVNVVHEPHEHPEQDERREQERQSLASLFRHRQPL